MERIPSMYLNMPSAAIIGLSNKGRELKELIIVAPMDCRRRRTNYLAKALDSP